MSDWLGIRSELGSKTAVTSYPIEAGFVAVPVATLFTSIKMLIVFVPKNSFR